MYKKRNTLTTQISLDDICVLLDESYNHDDIGNQIATVVEVEVFCMLLPTYSSEFFSAGHGGMKTTLTLLVTNDSYTRHQKAVYGGVTYAIYRVFTRLDGYTELYLTEKAGVYSG